MLGINMYRFTFKQVNCMDHETYFLVLLFFFLFLYQLEWLVWVRSAHRSVLGSHPSYIHRYLLTRKEKRWLSSQLIIPLYKTQIGNLFCFLGEVWFHLLHFAGGTRLTDRPIATYLLFVLCECSTAISTHTIPNRIVLSTVRMNHRRIEQGSKRANLVTAQ